MSLKNGGFFCYRDTEKSIVLAHVKDHYKNQNRVLMENEDKSKPKVS